MTSAAIKTPPRACSIYGGMNNNQPYSNPESLWIPGESCTSIPFYNYNVLYPYTAQFLVIKSGFDCDYISLFENSICKTHSRRLMNFKPQPMPRRMNKPLLLSIHHPRLKSRFLKKLYYRPMNVLHPCVVFYETKPKLLSLENCLIHLF